MSEEQILFRVKAEPRMEMPSTLQQALNIPSILFSPFGQVQMSSLSSSQIRGHLCLILFENIIRWTELDSSNIVNVNGGLWNSEKLSNLFPILNDDYLLFRYCGELHHILLVKFHIYFGNILRNCSWVNSAWSFVEKGWCWKRKMIPKLICSFSFVSIFHSRKILHERTSFLQSVVGTQTILQSIPACIYVCAFGMFRKEITGQLLVESSLLNSPLPIKNKL